MKLLIKNGHVIDPANNINTKMDLLVEDNKIKEVANNIDIDGVGEVEIIEANGMWVTPGLIDVHVHLRDPGFKYKETIETGTKSASMGGFTTICCMPNTDPVVDNEIVVEYINSKAAKEGVVNVLPIGSITKAMQGEELSSIGNMASAGICAISEDGKTVQNTSLMKTAMKYANMFNLPVLVHCEDLKLVGKGQINASDSAVLLGLKGISNDSEEVIVARDIILARNTDTKLHICHVSTKESIEHIRRAKASGQKITAEVCPHHFTLSDEDIKDYDSNFKMSPPLRSKADIEALKEALKDGTIDIIATDHAPHHEDEKNCEFESALNGIIGLETAVPLCITELVEKGILTPTELIAKLTLNPAGLLNIEKGSLSVNSVADITIIDPNFEHVIDKSKFVSLSKNTPFDGMKVKGRVSHTIVRGKVVVSKGELV